jgi:hypothetical protein
MNVEILFNGASAYHDDGVELLQRHAARGVLVMVFEGTKGNGCTFSTRDLELQRNLPSILRRAADLMERVTARGDPPHA